MSEQESGQVSEQEKEAIEEFKREYNDGRILKSDIIIELNTARIVNDLIDKLQKELDKYKRLAEANLKDSQEFQDNMCNHRCIKNNEVLELKAEIEKKDKVIDLMAEQMSKRPLMIFQGNEKENSVEILKEPKEIIDYYTKKAEE